MMASAPAQPIRSGASRFTERSQSGNGEKRPAGNLRLAAAPLVRPPSTHRTCGLTPLDKETPRWPTRLSTSGSTAPSRRRCCGRKTKILADGAEPAIWGFDGSSTNQAPGDNSDCVLRPVFVVPRPDPRRRQHPRHVRGAAHRHDPAPDQHPGRAARRSAEKYADQEPWFGIEQEYTFLKDGRPLGFPWAATRPRRAPTTAASAPTRSTAVTSSRRTSGLHRRRPRHLGHQRRGHARPVGVPGRPARPARGRRPAVARPLAALPHRRGLRHRRHLDPKPVKGDWNGAGAHTNFSTKAMRESYDADHHRLRGARRRRPRSTSRTTAPASSTASPACTRPPRGPSSATACPNRGASVRIPWQVEVDKKGYIEDRRPTPTGPLHRHPAHHRDLLRRAGRGRVAHVPTASMPTPGGAADRWLPLVRFRTRPPGAPGIR